MKMSGVSHGQSASELISKRIAELGGLARGNPQQNAQAHQGGRPRQVEIFEESEVLRDSASEQVKHWTASKISSVVG
jgi:hypothetical protein